MTKDQYGDRIVVDSGNLFCPRALPADDEREAFEKKAKLFVNAYRKQGCDALGFGGSDLAALGTEFAKALEKDAGFPFISTNIVDAEGKTFFKPGVIVEKDGVKFGFLSLADSTTQLPEGLTIQPPLEASKAAVATLKERGAEIIVLLSNLGKPETDKILAAVEGIDFALGDKSMSMPRYMESVGTSLYVGAGQKGKYLNVLTLNFTDLAKRPFVVRDMGEKFVKELQQLDSRLKRYERLVNSPPRPGTRSADPERYKSIIDRQLEQRKVMVEQIKDLQQVAQDSPFVIFEAVPMNKARNPDPEVQGWVDEYKKTYPEKKHQRPTGAAARRINTPKSVPGTTVNVGKRGGTTTPPPISRKRQ